MSESNRKFVQVSLTLDEWRLLRWYAYEMDVSTINKLLKEVALKVAEDYKKNG